MSRGVSGTKRSADGRVGRNAIVARPTHAAVETALAVRQATLADAAALTVLRLALLREERRNPLFAQPHPAAAARARQLTETQLKHEREIVLMAYREARLVGMLRCVEARGSPLVRRSRHAVLTTAYVRPGQRRRGVLRALVSAAEQWCRAGGLSEMRLHCALTNVPGTAAWRSLGFDPVEVLHRRLLTSA